MKESDIQMLEKNLGYNFNNLNYLKTALTHSSYANESKAKFDSNERLEFLGDSVLSIVVSDYIFFKCPDFPEGDLTKLRASLVCEKSLCKFSKILNVGRFLRLSHGEANSNGANRSSILADAFEAIIAAIYLDGGLEKARDFILKFIIPDIKNPNFNTFKDYKTQLQEIIQQNHNEIIKYTLVDQIGPDHDKRFVVEVSLNNNVIGKGKGKSKKEAEQEAAREALKLMGY